MRILNTAKVAAVSLVMSACTSAPQEQKGLREVIPAASVSKVITELAEESQKALDKTYKMFGRDTIYIGNSTKCDKEKLAFKISNLAQNASLIKKFGYRYTESCKCYDELKQYIFTKTKAVINSDKIFADNSQNLYVPVEYFGKN